MKGASMQRKTVNTVLLLLITLTALFSETGIANQEVAEHAPTIFDGFTMTLTNITIEDRGDDHAYITADYTWNIPNYSYQTYVAYLRKMNEILSRGEYETEHTISMRHKDFEEKASRSEKIEMKAPGEGFVGNEFLDYSIFNDKIDMTPINSVFSFSETYNDGTVNEFEADGTLGSISSINLLLAGEKAHILKMHDNRGDMFFNFKKKYPRVELLVRIRENIDNLKSITIRYDGKRNAALLSAWIQEPNQSRSYLKEISLLGDITSEKATTARAKEKLKQVGLAGVGGTAAVLMLGQHLILFFIAALIHFSRMKKRYRDIPDTPVDMTNFEGKRKSDISKFAVFAVIFFGLSGAANLAIDTAVISHWKNLSTDQIYEKYNRSVETSKDAVTRYLIKEKGDPDKMSPLLTEFIPRDKFTDEDASNYAKRITAVPASLLFPLGIIVIYLGVSLFFYLSFSKVPTATLELKKAAGGDVEKIGALVKHMIALSWAQQLPTFYNVYTKYGKEVRREADAPSNLLIGATFKIILPVLFILFGILVTFYFLPFWAHRAYVANFKMKEKEYQLWKMKLESFNQE